MREYKMKPLKFILRFKGGPGSGFHGHSGRKGMVGGSSSSGKMNNVINSNLVQEVKRNKTKNDFIELMAQKNNMSVDVYRKSVKNHLTDLVESSNQYIAIQASTIKNIVDSGEVLPGRKVPGQYMDTETSSPYAKIRYEAERTMYDEDNIGDGPIYTFISDTPPPSGKYGPVRLELNEDVKKRSTIVFGDSVDYLSSTGEREVYSKGTFHPEGLDAISIDSVPYYDSNYEKFNVDPLDWTKLHGELPGAGYAETHVFGGLKLSDIKTFLLPSDVKMNKKSGDYEPTYTASNYYTSIIKYLEDNGINWDLYDPL